MLKLLVIAVALAVASPALATPPEQPGQSPNGIPGPQGNPGPKGDPGQDGAPDKDGTDGVDGADGADGKSGKNGKDAPLDGIALGIAMANPTWLGDKENFAISGGWGGVEGANAFALTGVARIDQNWSANAGIGIAPDSSTVGYRAGVRVGW
jgi:hypothetical protein